MKMDRFFTQENCDRCGKSLKEGRTMSMFDTQRICMECKKQEMQRADYKDAADAEREEVEKGNYNYKGIEG